MKKIFLIALPILLMSALAAESLFSIVTKKEDAVMNHKYTRFVMVDDATGFALAKDPVLYDASGMMPQNYFTVDVPDLTGATERLFIVHNLTKSEGVDEYDWVLEDNADEKSIFYARSKFINLQASMQWRFIVRGERVLLRNLRTGNYLKVTQEGKFQGVTKELEASRIKLIHIF